MRVVIIANGQNFTNTLLLKKTSDADIILAADGGAIYCRENNIKPDYIIGDLDSLDNPLNQKVEVVHLAEQNTTDMQKALSFAEKLGASHIDIFYSFGKRTDHSLTNILILHNYSALSIVMYDEYGFFTALSPGTHHYNNKINTTISLFTISKIKGIELKGFKYPLHEDSIGPAFIGVSNTISHTNASLKFAEGRLLIYELYE